MKVFLKRHSNVLTAFALLISGFLANHACAFYYGQAPAPQSLKKLRKF